MIVHELRELLAPVVFIDWPLGKKGTAKKWAHLTVDHMTPAYLKKCERGNIGVALGRVSGDLIVVDVDADTLVLPYLAVNPRWKDTLQTHGARGCAFWLRMAGDYPERTMKLKAQSGEDAGEFRSNGSQSIIHGIHPNGNPYRIVNKARPVTVCFDQIVWPTQIATPPSHDTQRHRDTETQLLSHSDTQVTQVMLARGSVLDVDHAIQLAMPSDVHQNNNRLFTLARAVKSLEIQSGKFSREKLRNVFTQWYTLAGPYLRPDQTRDEYMIEFMKAYSAARTPLGDGIIDQAWKSAQTKPLPPEAVDGFTDEKFRLIVALCRELQINAGDKPFFLSSRTLAKLLGHPTHIAASRYMSALCVMGFIEEATKGTMGRASCYRYQGTLT